MESRTSFYRPDPGLDSRSEGSQRVPPTRIFTFQGGITAQLASFRGSTGPRPNQTNCMV